MVPLDLPLRTSRLTLRAHRDDDAGWIHRVYSRPDVARYLLDGPSTLEDAQRRATERSAHTDLNGEGGSLALVIERDQSPVGDVLLWFTERERRVAEIGWVLDPLQSGQGFATEAVRAVLDVAFRHYDLHRVTAQMDARNAASANLAGRAGMRQEAHLRQDWWSKGEWTDTVIFGMLSTDSPRSR